MYQTDIKMTSGNKNHTIIYNYTFGHFIKYLEGSSMEKMPNLVLTHIIENNIVIPKLTFSSDLGVQKIRKWNIEITFADASLFSDIFIVNDPVVNIEHPKMQ